MIRHLLLIASGILVANISMAQEAEMDHSHMDHHHAGKSDAKNTDDNASMRGGHHMTGALGSYPMTREASGTSWQPDSSPHTGIMDMLGDWNMMAHGNINFVYDQQGGPRGDTKAFASSMLMVMGQHPAGGGTLGLRGMFSLDPLMGKAGYPLLFQTGETADGTTPLIDRQHPHDLIAELAATYSRPVGADSSVFVYAGLPGEPALGPAAFMHRFSGMDNPESPITHHWLDSTHITYGVTTLGYVYRNWKLETSVFRGREPDQFRYNIETGKLDSHSVRLTYNPTPNWSAQISQGYIKSPEALESDENIRRTTASVTADLPYGTNHWQTTFAWGRNKGSHHGASDAYLLESALTIHGTHTFFGRIERADKGELFLPGSPLADESFTIKKLSVGYIHDFAFERDYKLGIGGLVSAYSIPSELDSTYGNNPSSFMLFARMKF